MKFKQKTNTRHFEANLPHLHENNEKIHDYSNDAGQKPKKKETAKPMKTICRFVLTSLEFGKEKDKTGFV